MLAAKLARLCLAMGMLMAANAAGQLVFLPLLGRLAQDHGWRSVSLMLLPFSGFDMISLSAFAVFNGVEWVATVPPIVKLLNEVFGKRDAPVLVSWVYALHQISSAVAAMGAGVLRGYTGSYEVAFFTSGLACLLAAGLVMRIGRGIVVAPA